MRRPTRFTLALLAELAFSSCGSGDDTTAPTPPGASNTWDAAAWDQGTWQ